MSKEKIRKNQKFEYSSEELRELGIFKDGKSKEKFKDN